MSNVNNQQKGIVGEPAGWKENAVLHRAGTRGRADHGWLLSHHTFSFANYYDPDRMHFGVLRVLNDDVVDGGQGFGAHPHENMEIISIPLEGDLAHQDSIGNTAVIKQGDVQVMSAGTGITHSEYNNNSDREVKFLQIWLFPNQRNVTPRYDQVTLDGSKMYNSFQQLLSPDPNDEGTWVHQNAWFYMGKFDEGFLSMYKVKREGNGVYAFVIRGSFEIDGVELNTRDGYGVWNVESLDVKSLTDDSQVILMDVPMQAG